jgi:hypothetical protein
MPEKSPPITSAKLAAKARREARLAAALRANLRRRKAAPGVSVEVAPAAANPSRPPTRQKP